MTEIEEGSALASIRGAWRRRQARWVLTSHDDRRLAELGLKPSLRRPDLRVHEPTRRLLDGLK